MGQLTFPPSSRVYLDTAPIIYSVEKHADYWQILVSLWQLLKSGEIEVITSELTLLETLVQPIRENNQILISAYETLLTKTEIELHPITLNVLRESAKLRAAENLKTPDAIHAATATAANCQYLLTNDPAFKRIQTLNVIILSDLL